MNRSKHPWGDINKFTMSEIWQSLIVEERRIRRRSKNVFWLANRWDPSLLIGRLAAYMGPLFNWEGLAVRVSPYKSPEREGTCHTRTTPLLTSPHTSSLPLHYSTDTTLILHFWCSCLTNIWEVLVKGAVSTCGNGGGRDTWLPYMVVGHLTAA